MTLKIAFLALLSIFLALPAFAQTASPASPAAPPAKIAAVALPQAGDDELLVLGAVQRDQTIGVWEGAVNIGLGKWTGATTLAGIATSFFSFGPATGVGAGGFVKQTFYQGSTGWRLYGSAQLLANTGSAAQVADGSGNLSLGVALKRGNVTGYLESFVQRPVGLNGSASQVQNGSLDQLGLMFGIGFGHPIPAAP